MSRRNRRAEPICCAPTIMARFLQINGSTRVDRNDMTARVADAISASGASVVDFAMFSNVSAMFRIGVPARNVRAFGESLRRIGLVMDDPSRQALASWSQSGRADDEITATLRIAFIRDEPDLCYAVPVPG